MLYLRPGSRIIQTQENIRNITFRMFNNQLPNEVEIGLLAKRLLDKAYKSGDYTHIPSPFLNELIETGFLLEGYPNEVDAPVFLVM